MGQDEDDKARAAAAQAKDTALGAALIANDKWLSWNILGSEDWATGTAEDLLSGGAWRRFGERIAGLAERIQADTVPADPATRADGYRYLAMLVRNGFDVALEDFDSDRPKIFWQSRRHKYGWDCPDAIYATVIVSPDAVYRLSGRRSNVHFLGLQAAAGMRTLANAHAGEWTIADDGSFAVVLGGPAREGNWMPLPEGTRWIFIREFFNDWERERPASLWLDRIDEGPRSEPQGLLDPAFFARRLDAVATHVEASVDLWMQTACALRERLTNAFPAENFGGTAMGAQNHQAAGTCYYRVAPDEALLIESPVPNCHYWSFDLCNFWLESLDFANHQSSLNGHQSVVDHDGVFRAVVAHQDPGVANWLDPVGHVEGSIIYRWNLTDAAPVPTMRVVPAADVRRHLPPETALVTRAERARTIEGRREGVRRRFARGLD